MYHKVQSYARFCLTSSYVIFFETENAGFSDYTEANTLYAYSDIVETVLESLLETKKLFQWF